MDSGSIPELPKQTTLVKAFGDSFNAIDILSENNLISPTLVLIYSTIDAAAWLDVRGDRDVKARDFITWVNSYLLPNSGLACTAEELYGARCGLLHSMTGESRLSRQRGVRFISYAHGDQSAEAFNKAAAATGHSGSTTCVHLDALQRALVNGVSTFLDEAATDKTSARWRNIEARAAKYFYQWSGPGFLEASRLLAQHQNRNR
jgi:hypothetical protein